MVIPSTVVDVDADLAALVPGFLARRREEAARLPELIGRGDFEAVRQMGHGFKGSGGGYGFDELTRLGAEIERAAKSHDAERLGQLAGAVSDYLSQVEVQYI